jgi:hypothetical protein
MEKITKWQTKRKQKFLLFKSLIFLVRSDTKMLSWPNSALLVILQFVDPNVMIVTPLDDLATLAGPSDYSTHENQIVLAKQLIEDGANVNAVSSPPIETP